MITLPIDGQSTTAANGGTLGSAGDSIEEGNARHRFGVEHGGTAIDDPPGLRAGLSGNV